MSINVDTCMNKATKRKMYCIRVSGKTVHMYIGSPTMGKMVAIRAFKTAIRLLLRGS